MRKILKIENRYQIILMTIMQVNYSINVVSAGGAITFQVPPKIFNKHKINVTCIRNRRVDYCNSIG